MTTALAVWGWRGLWSQRGHPQVLELQIASVDDTGVTHADPAWVRKVAGRDQYVAEVPTSGPGGMLLLGTPNETVTIHLTHHDAPAHD